MKSERVVWVGVRREGHIHIGVGVHESRCSGKGRDRICQQKISFWQRKRNMEMELAIPRFKVVSDPSLFFT